VTSGTRWWHLKRRKGAIARLGLSAMDEIFHPQAKNASLIREDQKSAAMDLSGSADPEKKITIKIKK